MAVLITTAATELAEKILMDTANERFLLVDLEAWLNRGVEFLITLKPTIAVQETDVVLIAGAKQTFPVDMAHFVKFTHLKQDNIAVTPVLEAQLDAEDPDWRAIVNVATCTHYIVDPNNLLDFYVYPPHDGTGDLVGLLAVYPADMATGGNFTIPDEYLSPLVDYVVFRALDQSEVPEVRAKGKEHFEYVVQFMTGKAATEGQLAQAREAAR